MQLNGNSSIQLRSSPCGNHVLLAYIVRNSSLSRWSLPLQTQSKINKVIKKLKKMVLGHLGQTTAKKMKQNDIGPVQIDVLKETRREMGKPKLPAQYRQKFSRAETKLQHQVL
eukprot:425078_1